MASTRYSAAQLAKELHERGIGRPHPTDENGQLILSALSDEDMQYTRIIGNLERLIDSLAPLAKLADILYDFLGPTFRLVDSNNREVQRLEHREYTLAVKARRLNNANAKLKKTIEELRRNQNNTKGSPNAL